MTKRSGTSLATEPQNDGRPKILHVFMAEKFIESFIDFVEDNFSNFDRHLFFCLGNEVSHPLRSGSYILFKSDYRLAIRAYAELVHQMYRADRIILHGLWNQWVIRLLSIQPWLLKKCYWVIWGADLYTRKFSRQDLMWHIKEVSRRIVIKRFGHLVTYIEGDVDLARQWYGAQGTYQECLLYPSNLYKDYDVPQKIGLTINIQIGNSADPENEHFEMLEILEPYKNEDIMIYAPLSYGHQQHALEVIEQGKRIFGGKFTAITDFMPIREYNKILGKIDVAILNHNRQQGMGNIITLLGFGKKVYMRSDVTSWSTLRKFGVHVFDVESFDLSPISADCAMRNRALIKNNFSERKLLRQLKDFLE